MADTTFIDGATTVVASWLNDVNDATYTTVPAHSSTLASGVVLKDSSTGGAQIPSGTTAQRPGAPVGTLLRYNTTISNWEGYNGSVWSLLASGFVASGAITTSGLTQTTARMLGRSTAGTGAVEEISVGSSLELLSSSLNVKDAGVGAAKLSGAQSGSAPIYGARAWCVFNGSTAGTNAPTAGGNVSTVTRNSVGNWTVTLATAMPTSTFAALAMSNRSSGTGNETGLSITATTTTTVTIVNYGYDGMYRDSSLISLAVFG